MCVTTSAKGEVVSWIFSAARLDEVKDLNDLNSNGKVTWYDPYKWKYFVVD